MEKKMKSRKEIGFAPQPAGLHGFIDAGFSLTGLYCDIVWKQDKIKDNIIGDRQKSKRKTNVCVLH